MEAREARAVLGDPSSGVGPGVPVATNTAEGNYRQGQLAQGPTEKRASFSEIQEGTS